MRGRYRCVIATITETAETQADTQADALTDDLAAFTQLLMRPGRGHAFTTMAEHDLSISQVRILHLLFGSERDPAQVEIAEQIALSGAAAGRAIDTLVRTGLVERHPDAVDRRIKRVALTSAGRAMVEEMAAGRRADFREFVDQLDPAERRRLANAIAPILSTRHLADGPRGCAP